MGVIATAARNAFRSTLATYKATNPTKQQVRKFVVALGNACNEWLTSNDRQDATAAQQFADSRTAQFATFVATLAEVALGPDPVEDP